MDYLKLIDIQQQVIELESTFKERISYLDENGNRKLDSYYFLSAETAAYKLLSSWVKRMRADEDFIDESIEKLVDRIQWLADAEYGEDFDIYESEYNMELWEAVLTGEDGIAYQNFNMELFIVASLAEVELGYETEETCLITTIGEADKLDPVILSYAYATAHDWIMRMPAERRDKFAREGFGLNAKDSDLFKLHFNLFQ